MLRDGLGRVQAILVKCGVLSEIFSVALSGLGVSTLTCRCRLELVCAIRAFLFSLDIYMSLYFMKPSSISTVYGCHQCLRERSCTSCYCDIGGTRMLAGAGRHRACIASVQLTPLSNKLPVLTFLGGWIWYPNTRSWRPLTGLGRLCCVFLLRICPVFSL